MKKSIFIVMLITLIGCLTQKTNKPPQKLADILPKQHGELFFFGDNGKILESDSGAFWVYDLLKINNGYKYYTYFNNKYSGTMWGKQPREMIIEEKKRNVFEMSIKTSYKKTVGFREIIDSVNNNYIYKDYDENYNLTSYGKTKNKFILQNVDTCFVFYKNGQKKSENYYNNGEMLGNKNWNEDGSEYISDLLNPYDIVPEYPGGEIALRKYIATNVVYPSKARKAGIEGKVFVSFVIMEDGNADGIKIVRKVNDLLDKEAIRIVKTLKKWKPGQINGKNIRTGYTLPINFQLN